MRRPRALAAVPLLLISSLVTASLALSPSAASAAPASSCAPAPASAVADALGIPALRADGLDGAGLTVGVISTSYDHYSPTAEAPTLATDAADDVASGALPGVGNPCGYSQVVQTVDDGTPGDDEGRAMLQIVHAIAPAADLLFATGVDSDPDATIDDADQFLAGAIKSLVDHGADVIVDDIMSYTDYAFAAGYSAAAAQRATEAGVVYTVAAGNLNEVGAHAYEGTPLPSAGRSIASWQTTGFRGADCPAVVAARHPGTTMECLDFDPGAAEDSTDEFTIYPEFKEGADPYWAVVEWAEAPYAATSELYGYLLTGTDESDYAILEDEILRPVGPGIPMSLNDSLFGSLPPGVLTTRSLVIAREAVPGAAAYPVRFAFLDDDTPSTVIAAEYDTSTETDTVGSTLIGRAADPSTVAVAAASIFEPTSLEPYSGIGPQTRYYGALTEIGVPPQPLSTPQTKTGPTVTGLDDIPTTFFNTLLDGRWYYPGTSAATPVVGAALALAKQAAPRATVDELTAALTSTATPLATTWVGTVPAQTSGAGLVNPAGLVAAVREMPAPAPAPAGGGSDRLAATGSTGTIGLLLLAAGLLVAGLAASRRRRA